MLQYVEDFDQAAPDRLIVSGYLRGVGAVQAAVFHAPLLEERLVGIDIGFEPSQRLKLLVVQRLGQHLSGEPEIEIEDLDAERFFRCEVITERSLRYACSLDDVPHARP